MHILCTSKMHKYFTVIFHFAVSFILRVLLGKFLDKKRGKPDPICPEFLNFTEKTNKD